jgi:U3 small nucleolar RNA-associated protein 22
VVATHDSRHLSCHLEKVCHTNVATLFQTFNSDLDGSPTDFTKLSAYIRIIPVLSPSSPIPLHRLSPSHSNIRTSSPASPSAPQPSTPIYNTALLLAFASKPHLLSTYTLLNTITSFHDALTLLRVWANQRGYTHDGIFGFDGKGGLWSAVLGVVLGGEEGGKRKPVGKGLSSYQLFRAALDFFGRL